MGALRKEQVQPRTGEVISLVPILERKAKKGLNPIQQAQLSLFQLKQNLFYSKLGKDMAFVLKGVALTAIVGAACACLIGGVNFSASSAANGPARLVTESPLPVR